jgi:hypothetical protein
MLNCIQEVPGGGTSSSVILARSFEVFEVFEVCEPYAAR